MRSCWVHGKHSLALILYEGVHNLFSSTLLLEYMEVKNDTIPSSKFPLLRHVECTISYIVFLRTVLTHIRGALDCKVCIILNVFESVTPFVSLLSLLIMFFRGVPQIQSQPG